MRAPPRNGTAGNLLGAGWFLIVPGRATGAASFGLSLTAYAVAGIGRPRFAARRLQE